MVDLIRVGEESKFSCDELNLHLSEGPGTHMVPGLSFAESSIPSQELSLHLLKLKSVLEQNRMCAISFSFSSRRQEGLGCPSGSLTPSLMESPLSGKLML